MTATYVIHAHNDYAELLLETGPAGFVLMLLFLAWWGAAVCGVWGSARGWALCSCRFDRIGGDPRPQPRRFPLRTAAISAVFAMCVALLADRRATPPAVKSDLRPTRHVVLR